MNDADKEYLLWVREYHEWYEREASRWTRLLGMCKLFTLVSSLVSAVLAASLSPELFASWGKWVLIAATALSVISSETLAQLQIRRMEELRENGHIEASHLEAYVRDKFDEYSNDRRKIAEIKDEVRNRILALETSQHKEFVDINSGRPAVTSKGAIPDVQNP